MTATETIRPSLFVVRVSSVFLALSVVGLVLPAAFHWGPHDGGAIGLGLFRFIVFPWSAAIAAVAAVFYLFRSRSIQGWCELGLAATLLVVAGLFFL